MTLWVNAIFGYPALVERDIFQIVRNDMGLGDMLVIINPTVVQMTYAQTQNGFSQDRLNAIINKVFPNKIVVTGVDSSYEFVQGGIFYKLSDFGGGVTVVKKSGGPTCAGSTPLYTNEDIYSVYDTSACGGKGYWVRDPLHRKIVEPPIAILFHELAHAYHWANRTSQQCSATPHVQAIGDENQMRVQFGLPPRSLTDEGHGCGSPEVLGSPSEDCFILNAVSGSPDSAMVHEFERIRDSLLRPTAFGHVLFARLITEYYQFAPRVVVDMEADPELKEWIKRLVVEPILDALTFIEFHVRLDLRSGTLDEEITRVFTQGRARLTEKGIDPNTAARLAELVIRFKADLDKASAKQDATQPQLGPLTPETIFRYFATTILANTPSASTLAWCLAHPLAIYWKTLTRAMPDQESLSSLRAYLADAIEELLSLMPLNWCSVDQGVDTLAADLQSVADCVLTSRAVRYRLGARFLARQPDMLRSRLAEVMRAADFLPADE